MEKNNMQKSGCAESAYCFWAKMIIGIPAIGIIVFVVASQFEDPMMQILNGATVGVLAVALAMKIESLPMLSGKIVADKDEQK